MSSRLKDKHFAYLASLYGNKYIDECTTPGRSCGRLFNNGLCDVTHLYKSAHNTVLQHGVLSEQEFVHMGMRFSRFRLNEKGMDILATKAGSHNG